MDLFTYLLLKNTNPIKETSGTTIEIEGKKLKNIVLTKQSTQEGSPDIDNPVDITVITENIDIELTNGTDTKTLSIPLGNNEICGIGDYKDELFIDKLGHCYLKKKVGKAIFNGEETSWVKLNVTTADKYRINTSLYTANVNSLCNYFVYQSSSNNVGKWYNNVGTQLIFVFAEYNTTTLDDWIDWLELHNVICYQPLQTEEVIDLNYTVDMRLLSGTNTITNSENADMVIQYF